MDFVEDVWVSQERAKTGVCADVNGPAAIFDAREIIWISVAESTPAEGNEARVLLVFCRIFRHLKNSLQASPGTAA